jgi:hypothetical protein
MHGEPCGTCLDRGDYCHHHGPEDAPGDQFRDVSQASVGSYKTILPDADKPLEAYTATERRAYLLDRIVEAGHPDLVSRQAMGERFGVSPQQVSKDIRNLALDLRDGATEDFELLFETVIRKGVKEKMRDGDLEDALTFLREWKSWLFRSGRREEAADKHELTDGEGGPALMMLDRIRDIDEDNDG